MPYRRPVDRPLRRDVRWLGRLLGRVIRAHEGEVIFALEERIRRLAILRRRGPKSGRREAAVELLDLVHGLPTEQAEPIIRAFSHYFGLVNLAEQHHRVRRARAHATARGGPPQRGSLASVLQQLRTAGVPAETVRSALATLEVTLTLTAHPTEAARRTVLEKLYRIAQALEKRDSQRLTARERDDLAVLVHEQIAILWQTDEVRREKPGVNDEVKNVTWYIDSVLWDLLPVVTREIGRAFERAYGEPLGVPRLPIRLHSWVGGDMDGNPFVTPDVLADAIRVYRERGLRQLIAAVRELGATLSQSSRYLHDTDRILASLRQDESDMPEIAEAQRARTEGEPWRRKLGFVEARLAAALAEVEHLRAPALHRVQQAAEQPASFRYRRARELEADLELIADTLHESAGADAGERQARELLERVRALGLQLAELEMRAPAAEVRAADQEMQGARETTPSPSSRILLALQRIAEAQKEAGARACRTLVLSMTEGEEDLLSALRCAGRAGLFDEQSGAASLDIVPLFETHAALEHCPTILRQALADPAYRRHVEVRGVQEVMIGYSDSGKESGLLAASLALYRAQRALTLLAHEVKIPIRIFHGRGETVARGGGPAQAAILALPRGSVAGRYKATEQGEALDHKYGRPELGLRTLELVVAGALLHTLDAQPQVPPSAESRYLELWDELAAVGRRVYRQLVWDNPSFGEFFYAGTPIEEIARMPIGSRPSKRHQGGLEALRAIPWVFAWTQTRAMLPAWYGVGSALSEVGTVPPKRELLFEMYQSWPIFRATIDNLEMVLAKTDMRIAARYASLAPVTLRQGIWPQIREEFSRTLHWVKQLTGNAMLLDKNPPLQRSIRLRNPYVDPLNLFQLELVRRKRLGQEDCDRPILLTINGIAAGMRNTG